uniref:Uncharacterized protein n=1 Tax=Anguilla anguilla TaxID=7936 RepID=A0A0E9XP91_ANGAN
MIWYWWEGFITSLLLSLLMHNLSLKKKQKKDRIWRARIQLIQVPEGQNQNTNKVLDKQCYYR